MNELPLNALRAFAVIHEHRGVRAAARVLGIAHSSVSRHLAELEAWLGVTLVESRTKRGGMVFTAQGEALGAAVTAGLERIARAVEAVRETRSSRSVTISTTPSVASRWLLPRLPALERAHRAIEVSIVIEQQLDDLQSSGIDLAIRMGSGPWSGVRARPLMTDALYPVMSPLFHATNGRPRTPQALVGLRLLHDRDPNTSWDAWRRAHGPARLDVRRGPRFASSDLVLRAAAQGQGVALARDRLVHDDLASGALIRPIPDAAVELATAYWIVLPERESTASTMAVVEWLAADAATAPLR
ncbi:MAG: LysR substrate-binding domain-containing protein [Kofleriaceae bacterium]